MPTLEGIKVQLHCARSITMSGVDHRMGRPQIFYYSHLRTLREHGAGHLVINCLEVTLVFQNWCGRRNTSLMVSDPIMVPSSSVILGKSLPLCGAQPLSVCVECAAGAGEWGGEKSLD